MIDSSFYHDGGNRCPRNVKLDDTFYRDPKTAAPTNGQGNAPRIRLDEWLRDDESDDNNIGSSEKDKVLPPKRRWAAVDHATEVKNVAAVADNPVLLRYCVERLHGNPASYLSPTSSLQSHRPITMVRDTNSAQRICNKSSIARLLHRNIKFGVCGLSVLHFKRFKTAARRKWRQEGCVNMSNFSPKVDLPKLPNQDTLLDPHECFMVLSLYAEALFDCHAQRIVSHARSFCDELKDYEG
ncbi:hypothetical protein PRNP1_007620 [Phytophthora ramorum]